MIKAGTHQGFTLIEVLLSLALLAGIVGVSIPLYNQFISSSNLLLVEDQLQATVKQAKTRASNGYNDTDWGVRFSNQEIVIFAGNNYSNRDQSLDTLVELPQGVSIDEVATVIFTRPFGEVDSVSEFTFTANDGTNSSYSINEKGVLQIQ